MRTVRARVAANIKNYRKAVGLSVDDVGKAIGKSGKTISAWEVGRGQPDADETVALCQLLGIELFELYGEKRVIDEREERLLDHYRELSSSGQDALLAIARTLVSVFPRE